MKKLILSFLVIFLLTSCNNKADKKSGDTDTTKSVKESKDPVDNKSIVGKWKPVKVELPELSEENKQNLLNNATLEFTADGKFLTTMKGDTKNGTYTFNEKDASLSTQAAGGKDETFKVEWDKDLVILKNEEGAVTMKRVE